MLLNAKTVSSTEVHDPKQRSASHRRYRGFLGRIRGWRNHDLLPEEEAARLLDMSVEACRKLALEMDFLDIKLGGRPDALPQD